MVRWRTDVLNSIVVYELGVFVTVECCGIVRENYLWEAQV